MGNLKKGVVLVSFFVALVLVSLSGVSATFEFNGTVLGPNGTKLGNSMDNATLNVSVKKRSPRGHLTSVYSDNSTNVSSDGSFNISLEENSSYFYQPKVTYYSGGNNVKYVSQSPPALPLNKFKSLSNVTFYLRQAGTINITALDMKNSSERSSFFNYDVVETASGAEVADGKGQCTPLPNCAASAVFNVPKNRNYTITIFGQGPPLSFEWNNFSSSSSYNISNISSYNASSETLHKQFNWSMSIVNITGQFNESGVNGWDNLTVMPLLIEPGNAVSFSEGNMPMNLGNFDANLTKGSVFNDTYNLSTGNYTIGVPQPAETMDTILFAIARNGSDYYGGVRNISLNNVSQGDVFNFNDNNTFKYLGNSTGRQAYGDNISSRNVTIPDANRDKWASVNVSIPKQKFELVNASNNKTLSDVSGQVEITIDYSDYGAKQVNFRKTISADNNGTFYLPLLNASSIKEMVVYTKNYAPKRFSKPIPIKNNQIPLSEFNPKTISGGGSSVSIELYESNATCDEPATSCKPTLSTTKSKFNPLEPVVGGGDLNFKMGTGNVEVKFIDVDLLASGPPTGLFDSDSSGSTSGGFSKALRFGSNGPSVYDYVLVSIPYTEGSSSQSGLNESAKTNISIPNFYTEDDSGNIDWSSPSWNTSVNGTNATHLAGNISHYSGHESEWQTLMNDSTCVTNKSKLNSTNPCYKDKSNNRLWVRLPHFSGTEPSVSGGSVSASSNNNKNNNQGSSGGSSNGGSVSGPSKSHGWSEISPGKSEVMKGFGKEIGVNEIKISVKNKVQDVVVDVKKHDGKPAEVSVEKSGKVYQYLEIDTKNLNENLDKATVRVKVEKSWAENNSLGKEDVVVSKFDDSAEKWNELETSFDSEDEEFYYYKSEVNSFSYFSIGEKTVSENGSGSGSDSQEEASKDSGQKDSGATGGTTNQAGEGFPTWAWIVIAVVLIGLVVWFVWNKNSK